MRLLRLASVVIAVCSSPALAAPGDSLPNSRQELAEARGDWRAVNDAPRLLKLGLYGALEHRATASALESLPGKLLAAKVPPERVAKVRDAATAAGRREAEFWAGLSPAQQAGRSPASPEALARVVAPLEALRTELTPLFLGTETTALRPGATPPPSRPELEEARRSQTVRGNVDHSVSSVRSAGGASGEDGARFWDRNTRRGDADAGVDSSGMRGLAQAPPPTQPILAGIGPFASLQTSVVPNPTRPAGAPTVTQRIRPTGQLRDAASTSVSQAVNAATRTGFPARVNAETLAGPAGRSPQTPIRVGVSPEEAQQATLPGPSPCEQVLQGKPEMIVSMCKNHPNVALLWGGLYQAFTELLGPEALVMNLIVAILALLLSALSGFGVIVSIVKTIASLALMAMILPMLKEGWDAFWKWKGAAAGTMENASSLYTMGKVGSSILIMALMAYVGWKVGKTPVGARMSQATQSMERALTSAMAKSKVGAVAAAPDLLLPAGLRGRLQTRLGVSPQGRVANAPDGHPTTAAEEPSRSPVRPPVSSALPPELKPGQIALTSVDNAIPSQMGVGRAQVQRVADKIVKDARKKALTDPAYQGLTDEQSIAKFMRDQQADAHQLLTSKGLTDEQSIARYLRDDGVSLSDKKAVKKASKLTVEAYTTPDGAVMVTDAHHRISAMRMVIDKHLQGLDADQLPQVMARFQGDFRGRPVSEFHMTLAKARKGQFSVEQRQQFRSRLDELRRQGHPDPEGAAHKELFDQLPKSFSFKHLGNDRMRSAMGNSLFDSGVESGLYYDYFEFKFYQHLAEKGITFNSLVKRATLKGYKPKNGVPPEADPMVLWELRHEMLKPDVIQQVLTDAKRFRVQPSAGVSPAEARRAAAGTIQRFIDNAVKTHELEGRLWKANVSDYVMQDFRHGKRDVLAFMAAARREAGERGVQLGGEAEGLVKSWFKGLDEANTLKAALDD